MARWTQLNRPLLLGAIGLASAAGCASRGYDTAAWDNDARGATNVWAVNSVFEDQAARSVERRRTITDAHFVDGTAVLTARGKRDARTIAAFLVRTSGGPVYMPGREGDNAFQAKRRDAVLAAMAPTLERGGLTVASVRIEDEMFPDAGEPSSRVREAYVEPFSDEPYDFHGRASDIGGE
ncbi:MAG: hypothetical protein CMJ31_01220 [Phycisphaerae bacterium]|nr:hypothetical protein [Phycisphaerae bacterium]